MQVQTAGQHKCEPSPHEGTTAAVHDIPSLQIAEACLCMVKRIVVKVSLAMTAWAKGNLSCWTEPWASHWCGVPHLVITAGCC